MIWLHPHFPIHRARYLSLSSQQGLMEFQKTDKRPYFSSLSLLFIVSVASSFAAVIHPEPCLSKHRNQTVYVESVFHPLDNAALFRQRMEHPCPPGRVPRANELSNYPNSSQEWNVDRFAAYYNIYPVLKARWENVSNETAKEDKPKVLELGPSYFLDPFRLLLNVTRTHYPGIDIHRTPYPDGSFDLVAADQVLEHVIYPPVAMLEMKRILRPGGLVVLTTVAYNPVHKLRFVDDFWRFMPDSLKVLSMPFDGGIKACGSWGTADVIAIRAKLGLGSKAERKIYAQNRTEFLTRNDGRNSLLVWLIVQK